MAAPPGPPSWARVVRPNHRGFAISIGALAPGPAERQDLESLIRWAITPHAERAMARRRISRRSVARVLAETEQAWEVRPGRWVFQSREMAGEFQEVLLVRVFVDLDRDPPEVVTVYRTSQVGKYWRGAP